MDINKLTRSFGKLEINIAKVIVDIILGVNSKLEATNRNITTLLAKIGGARISPPGGGIQPTNQSAPNYRYQDPGRFV